MDPHGSYTQAFGNPIAPREVRFAFFKYRVCRFLFSRDDRPVEPGAVAAGEAYNDFGMLTIVDKNKTKGEVRDIQSKHAIIIGTIRMGFGHWRIAIAMASAAKRFGYTPYLLDLTAFDGSTAQKSIRFLQYWYDVLSRVSQRWKWFNKHIWEKATSVENRPLSASVNERILSQLFEPILELIPEDVPLLSMHPWVGHAAIMGGVKNVVSIIPDNYPMGFWLVEGSRQTVQSPSAYMGYRTLLSMDGERKITHCLEPHTLLEAGHYVDYEIVSAIEADCKRRIERMKEGKPRRFLLTMGGAGAQAQRFADIIETCKTFIECGKAAFFVNMGDHAGRWKELKANLDKSGVSYTIHTDWSATKRFVKEAETDDARGVHVFLHDEFYAAVYLTNLLMHASDIMITKPSELSFYPIPKIVYPASRQTRSVGCDPRQRNGRRHDRNGKHIRLAPHARNAHRNGRPARNVHQTHTAKCKSGRIRRRLQRASICMQGLNAHYGVYDQATVYERRGRGLIKRRYIFLP